MAGVGALFPLALAMIRAQHHVLERKTGDRTAANGAVSEGEGRSGSSVDGNNSPREAMRSFQSALPPLGQATCTGSGAISSTLPKVGIYPCYLSVARRGMRAPATPILPHVHAATRASSALSTTSEVLPRRSPRSILLAVEGVCHGRKMPEASVGGQAPGWMKWTPVLSI